MRNFIETFFTLFIDMGYYLMIGITLAGILNLFLKKEFIAKHLGGSSLFSSIKACIFGVPLPLCSCAVIPTSIYLKDSGASDSTTVAFLISTPQTGVDSIIATYGMMGFTFAWFRPVAAFLSGVIGGLFVGIFGNNKKKKDLTKANDTMQPESNSCACNGACDNDMMPKQNCCIDKEPKAQEHVNLKDKIKSVLRYSYIETISEISVHFIIGLFIAALITILLPPELIADLNLGSGIITMLLMILIGLPMYICSSASIPIALTLMAKGISPGAAFVFLFMGPFTNAASLSILVKKLGKKIVALYVFIAVISAIGFGYLLDFLVSRFDLSIIKEISINNINSTSGIIKLTIAVIFFALLVYSLITKFAAFYRKMRTKKMFTGNYTLYRIEGMTCGHCSSHVQAALLKDEDIKKAKVDHEKGIAKVWGNASEKTIIDIVDKAGYKVILQQ